VGILSFVFLFDIFLCFTFLSLGRYGQTEGLFDEGCTSFCPLGHYCPEATINPILCPAGVFGAATSLIDSSCSPDCLPGIKCNISYSLCFPGYYCPEGSISGQQYECGDTGLFFSCIFIFTLKFECV
jgi:hypothetical protein